MVAKKDVLPDRKIYCMHRSRPLTSSLSHFQSTHPYSVILYPLGATVTFLLSTHVPRKQLTRSSYSAPLA
jgi:hypothetical protein